MFKHWHLVLRILQRAARPPPENAHPSKFLEALRAVFQNDIDLAWDCFSLAPIFEYIRGELKLAFLSSGLEGWLEVYKQLRTDPYYSSGGFVEVFREALGGWDPRQCKLGLKV